jgi:hypothetical protein
MKHVFTAARILLDRHRRLGPHRPHRTEELPQGDLREVKASAERGQLAVFSRQ